MLDLPTFDIGKDVPALAHLQEHGDVYVPREGVYIDEREIEMQDGILVTQKWAREVAFSVLLIEELEKLLQKARAEGLSELKGNGFTITELSKNGNASIIYRVEYKSVQWVAKIKNDNPRTQKVPMSYIYEMLAMQDLASVAGQDLARLNVYLPEVYCASSLIACRQLIEGICGDGIPIFEDKIPPGGLPITWDQMSRAINQSDEIARWAEWHLSKQRPELWRCVLFDITDECLQKQNFIISNDGRLTLIDPFGRIFVSAEAKRERIAREEDSARYLKQIAFRKLFDKSP